MMKLTLVDSKVAKPGYEFINYGGADECRDCKLVSACTGNLKKGRKYRITGTRDVEHECKITGQATLVEVEECDLFYAMDPKKVFIGSKITFIPVPCGNIFCSNMKYCRPEGLTSGDQCKIRDSAGKIECESGNDFVLVKLKRL